MPVSIAVVTARAARGLDDDMPLLEAALSRAGADFRVVDWDDESVRWNDFDVAVVRSPWDYSERLAEFLKWMDRVSGETRLINPAAVMRWNTDKHYLADLEAAGAPVVPSAFAEPGEDAGAALDAFLSRHATREFVVKPSVGGGSRDAQRYGREDREAATAHVCRLLDADRSVVMQPYLDLVDAQGETALIFFNGVFSHAICKGALLHRGHAPTRALFAPEKITARTPAAEELQAAQRVLAAAPFKDLLYARVDLLRDADGTPKLLELELTEPSLFFDRSEGSADRFVAALLARENAV